MIGSQVLVLAAIIVVLFIVLFIRLRKGIRAGQRSRNYAMPAEKKSSLGNRIITFFVLLYSLYQLYKLSTTTTVLDIKWIVAVLVGLIILAIVVLRQRRPASQVQNVNKPRGLGDISKTYPELKNLTMEAKQNGASHFDYAGPAIFFYRNRDGKIERCFAEYSPANSRYEWIWTPSSWHADVEKIPEHALPIPETI